MHVYKAPVQGSIINGHRSSLSVGGAHGVGVRVPRGVSFFRGGIAGRGNTRVQPSMVGIAAHGAWPVSSGVPRSVVTYCKQSIPLGGKCWAPSLWVCGIMESDTAAAHVDWKYSNKFEWRSQGRCNPGRLE